MRKILLLLVVLYPALIVAQNSKGRIIYSITINVDDKVLEADRKYGLISNAIETSKNLEFNLDFFDKKSKFYRVDNLNIDSQSAYIASTFCSSFDAMYFDIEKNEILAEKNSINHLTADFNTLVRLEVVKDWQITNDSKKIGEFLCYKATGKKINSYLDKNYEEEVTAWFCPSLPYAFGPTQYNGLPGLILEIQESKVIIGVKKLEIGKDITLKFDSSKKIISKQQFDILTKERLDKMIEESGIKK